MKNLRQSRFRRAKKRVELIKGFYKHLIAYMIVNIILIVVKSNVLEFFITKGVQNQGFIDWLEWNIIGTPILWGIGLFFHGLYVFKFKSKPFKELMPKYIRDWEKNQIQKYMEEENRTTGKY